MVQVTEAALALVTGALALVTGRLQLGTVMAKGVGRERGAG
jgi:hypothetical protein